MKGQCGKILLVLVPTILIHLSGKLHASSQPLEVMAPSSPTLLHTQTDGYGEYPSIALSRNFVYVAYGVSRHDSALVYLARLKRSKMRSTIKTWIQEAGSAAFRPSVAAGADGEIWIAWNSFLGDRWIVNACRIKQMEVVEVLTVSEPQGFNSECAVESRGGVVWFVWCKRGRRDYRILARPHSDGQLGKVVEVYKSAHPLGRPDLCVLKPDHVIFVWDEFAGKCWRVQVRAYENGELKAVEGLEEESYANEWEPHIAAVGDGILLSWHRVPQGSGRCQPSATILGSSIYRTGIDRPRDPETFHVTCFGDAEGGGWVAWATRPKHRYTRLLVKRVSTRGVGRTLKFNFPMRRRFMNTFDCAADTNFVFTFDSWGNVYLCEVPIPEVASAKFSIPSEAKSMTEFSLRSVPDLTYSFDYDGERLNLYFGDAHSHTSFSDGRAYPDISIVIGREIRKLDYVGVSDHDGSLTIGELRWSESIVDNLTEPGKFLSFYEFEASKGWAKAGYGHWTVIMENPCEVFRYQNGMKPVALFEFARKCQAVVIPHHVAIKWAPYNWDYFDAVTEPVFEICSIHGIFENQDYWQDTTRIVRQHFIQDGLQRGYRFGFVGGSDFHNCFSAIVNEHGITGVYAPALTREAILEAMRARRTFATTGSRMILDFRCNGRLMGEEITGADSLVFTGYIASPDTVVSVEIISSSGTIYRDSTSAPEVRLREVVREVPREGYYYLRVHTSGGDIGWSSPIWIVSGG